MKFQVCDLVRVGNERYRVSGHMKRVPATLPIYDKDDNSMEAIAGRIVNNSVRQEVAKERKQRKADGLPHKRRYKLLRCTPEEATHLSLTGVCGRIVPISECTHEGTVNWDQATIEQERANTQRPERIEFANLMHPIIKWE